MTSLGSFAGVLALAAFVWPSPATAQVVSGRVVESGSERPIVLASVALTDTTFQVVDGTLTDHDGAFQLPAPGPGSYYLRVDRLGYATSIDGILDLDEGGYIEVTFYVRPNPIALEGVTATVEAERVEAALELSGFYDRRNQGFGDFIGPEEVDEPHVFNTADLLRGIPGVRASGGGITCNGSGPRVFVDGTQLALPDSGVDLGALPFPEEIAGIEVYRRLSSLPLQYGGTFDGASQGRCTFLVWTKS